MIGHSHKKYESESISGLRLFLAIIYETERATIKLISSRTNSPSFSRRPHRASEVTVQDFALRFYSLDYKYPFASSSSFVTVPKTMTSFINESTICKTSPFNFEFLRYRLTGYCQILFMQKNPLSFSFRSHEALEHRNRDLAEKSYNLDHEYPLASSLLLVGFNNNSIFLGSTFGYQFSLYADLRPFLVNRNLIPQLGESSSSSFNCDCYLQHETEIGNFVRQMVENSALYMYRLVDYYCLSQPSSESFIIVTDSNRLDNLMLVTQEFEVLSQAIVYYPTHEIHNSYGDSWLDVDNMSYEELLALGDQIGYANTGLSEEEALKSLKRSKFFLIGEEDSQREFCSICQEEYLEEDELGTLDCGHNFHIICIKQWLGYKSNCPICKSYNSK